MNHLYNSTQKRNKNEKIVSTLRSHKSIFAAITMPSVLYTLRNNMNNLITLYKVKFLGTLREVLLRILKSTIDSITKAVIKLLWLIP